MVIDAFNINIKYYYIIDRIYNKITLIKKDYDYIIKFIKEKWLK